MTTQKLATLCRLALTASANVLILGMAWPSIGEAQDPPDTTKDHSQHPQHQDKPLEANRDLAAKFAELRAKLDSIEAIMEKSQPSAAPGMAGMKGKGMGAMGGMKDMDKVKGGMEGKGMADMPMESGMGGMQGKGMGKMADKAPGAMEGMKGMDTKKGGMEGKGMADMSKGSGMEGMDMMGMMGKSGMGGGGMKGMDNKMKMPAALPAFPGASHIYHIGATGFFLNHSDQITLTTEQQASLNAIKQKALLEKSSAQGKIEGAERELWELTSAGEPDAGNIEAKVGEIAKLRGAQRLAFIRAVGEAAKVLTDEQRQALPEGTQPQPAPVNSH